MPEPKLYVVRKYVFAHSIEEAMQMEKHVAPDDCWLDDDWKKAHTEYASKPAGFRDVRNTATG